jgi:hypothetical protein
MKIILSNKFYYPRGGDCVYTLNLEQLLKQHGHEVAIFAMQYPGMLFESRNVEDLKDKIQQIFAVHFDCKSIAESAQYQYSGDYHYNELMRFYKQ